MHPEKQGCLPWHEGTSPLLTTFLFEIHSLACVPGLHEEDCRFCGGVGAACGAEPLPSSLPHRESEVLTLLNLKPLPAGLCGPRARVPRPPLLQWKCSAVGRAVVTESLKPGVRAPIQNLTHHTLCSHHLQPPCLEQAGRRCYLVLH